MPDIKNNKNNKEKKSQDKLSPATKKILDLFKPQPDRVPDSKKSIVGKKILEILNKMRAPESDIEIIIDYIDWDELKKSCADFYVNVPRINHSQDQSQKMVKGNSYPLKIFLKIIKELKYFKVEITKNPIIHYDRKIFKKSYMYHNFKILVKYINNIGFESEKKLEFKHGIMDHSSRIAKIYLETKKIPKSSTEEMVVREQIVEEVERITYPKILLYLNTFTYYEVTKRINNAKKDDLGENVKEGRNLEDLKDMIKKWFSENQHVIPRHNERSSSLNLLNTADSERLKTSKAVIDEKLSKPDQTVEPKQVTDQPEPDKKDIQSQIVKVIKDMGLNKSEKRLPQFKKNPIKKWENLRLTYSYNKLDKVSLRGKEYTAGELGFKPLKKGDECVHFIELITIIENIDKNNKGTIRPETLDQIKRFLKEGKMRKRIYAINSVLKDKIGLKTNPIRIKNGFYKTDIQIKIIEDGNQFRQSKFSTEKSDKETYDRYAVEKSSTKDESDTPCEKYDEGSTRYYLDRTDETDIEYDDYGDGNKEY